MEENVLLLIQPNDNVAIALRELHRGTCCRVGDYTLTLRQDIPPAHKVALRDIGQGEQVIKYGLPIGHAAGPIAAGDHVHIHNVITNLEGLIQYKYQPDLDHIEAFRARKEEAWFDGYLREDGRAGTRNEIWIVPTVGCVNQTARILAGKAREKYAGKVDDVQALVHNAGCSQLGEDMLITQKLLKG